MYRVDKFHYVNFDSGYLMVLTWKNKRKNSYKVSMPSIPEYMLIFSFAKSSCQVICSPFYQYAVNVY